MSGFDPVGTDLGLPLISVAGEVIMLPDIVMVSDPPPIAGEKPDKLRFPLSESTKRGSEENCQRYIVRFR